MYVQARPLRPSRPAAYLLKDPDPTSVPPPNIPEGADHPAVASFLLAVVKAEISIPADYLGRLKIDTASHALWYGSARVP